MYTGVNMLLAGVAAGVCSGVFGIGGGIILVPALTILFHYPHLTANGISLVALLLPVGALGVFQYYKSGNLSAVHFKFGLLIACGMFLGAYLGAKFALALPQGILNKAFSVFLVLVALRLWFLKP
jgi:uncharacterized membrane protein YfcA